MRNSVLPLGTSVTKRNVMALILRASASWADRPVVIFPCFRVPKGLIASDNPTTQAEQSSRVQAVVAYFPPTDFMNYGAERQFFIDYMKKSGGSNSLQALDLIDHDDENFLRNKVKDEARLAQHYRDIAPYYHVSVDDPPTLLIHGDADDRVPIQQSERIAAKFQAEGVDTQAAPKGWRCSWLETG